ncbi:SSI family serine proteinase inhibitor [Kitasatospora sp. NPDC057500]|uniref:SSI family serine proteinase inhibitor n=1 Tax=Kitasatospora sp. NPDC057500 TaxID=3346151 RepID=UPI00368D678C
MKTTPTLALLATALLATGLAGTANAITPVPVPAADAVLRLTVAHGPTPTSGTPHVVSLDCPPGGSTTHPDPFTACRLVDSVNGDLGQLNVDPGVCNQIYDPYTVTATGVYRGRHLSFQRTYGNHCVLLRTTGALFDF